MFKTIVVGINGAEGGETALAYATQLADADTRLVLVHAYPYEEHATRAANPEFAVVIEDDATAYLKTLTEGRENCALHVVPDVSPGRAIHKYADHEDADLIVVGSNHRGPVGRLLAGDVARATMHGAHCPVAVVPTGFTTDGAKINTIGVAYNGTPESIAALDFAARIAKDAGATLRIRTAVLAPSNASVGYAVAYDWSALITARLDTAKADLAEAAERVDVSNTTELVRESAGTAIKQLSDEVDLLVAGTRSWGATKAVLLGSTTDWLSHHAGAPMIVVPGPDKSEHAAKNQTREQAVHA